MQYDTLPWGRWSAAGLIWVSSAAAAQPWGHGPHGGAPQPTRLSLCQHEVGLDAADRSAQLRACLARRLEGERLVERDCKRQAAAVAGNGPRQQAARACERSALGVPSTDLPRRPPPPPRARPLPEAPAAETVSAARQPY